MSQRRQTAGLAALLWAAFTGTIGVLIVPFLAPLALTKAWLDRKSSGTGSDFVEVTIDYCSEAMNNHIAHLLAWFCLAAITSL